MGIRFWVNITLLKKSEKRDPVTRHSNSMTLTSDSVERPPNTSPLSLLIPREHPDQSRTGFGSESLLLRGCTIRNTKVAVGIVIYAGNCPRTASCVPVLYPLSSKTSSKFIFSQWGLTSVLRGRVMWLPISQLIQKTCMQKIIRHWWKKLKMIQIDGELYHVLGLEESALWKWLYYPFLS